MVDRSDPEIDQEFLLLVESPCNVIVTMQHEAGCTYLSYRPFLKIIGLILLATGITLFLIGLRI